MVTAGPQQTFERWQKFPANPSTARTNGETSACWFRSCCRENSALTLGRSRATTPILGACETARPCPTSRRNPLRESPLRTRTARPRGRDLGDPQRSPRAAHLIVNGSSGTSLAGTICKWRWAKSERVCDHAELDYTPLSNGHPAKTDALLGRLRRGDLPAHLIALSDKVYRGCHRRGRTPGIGCPAKSLATSPKGWQK